MLADNAAAPPSEDDLRQANEAAQLRKPKPGDWGFYSYLDGPPVCGGGSGAFAWFDDQAAMYAYIHDYFAWLPEVMWGRNDQNKELGPSVQAAFEDAELVGDPSRLREAFNELFEGEFQIPWWGPFDSLLRDTDEFPDEVRLSFWEDYGEGEDWEGTSPPIPAEFMDDFVEFVGHYGS